MGIEQVIAWRIGSEQVGVLIMFLTCRLCETGRKPSPEGEEEGTFTRRWQ